MRRRRHLKTVGLLLPAKKLESPAEAAGVGEFGVARSCGWLASLNEDCAESCVGRWGGDEFILMTNVRK